MHGLEAARTLSQEAKAPRDIPSSKPSTTILQALAKTQMEAEWQALLWICESPNGDYCAIRLKSLITRPTFNWKRLLRLAKWHGVVPLCYRNSQRLIANLMPTPTQQALRQRYYQVAKKNLGVVTECQRITKICEQHNATITHFKGPSLAIWLYNDPTLRTYSDVDALISQTDQTKIRPTLENLGYQLKHPFTPKQWQHHLRHHKDTPYRNEDKNITLELHWHFAYHKPSLQYLAQHIYKFRQLVNWQGMHFYTLEPHAYTCYLAFHGSLEGWKKTKWLIDFHHAYLHCDTQKLLNLSDKFGVRLIVEHAILLSKNYFKAMTKPQNIQFHRKSTKSVASSQLLLETNAISSLKQRFLKYRLRWLLASAPGMKTHLIKRCLNTNHAHWRYIALGDRWFFLYYLIRPIHWLIKHSGQHGPKTRSE